jgi:undecaprenyl-diphosphatase
MPLLSDIIARLFLSFSQEIIIITAAVLGYIWFDRKIFFNAICLILLSMLFNFSLKATFQVPLSKNLGEGFAFPSGHMQSCAVFYGWLITKIQKPVFRTLVIMMLIGIGFSLVYFGYHNYLDVTGGVFFAVLLIFAYRLMLAKKACYHRTIILSFATILMLYAAAIYKIADHLWMGYYCLIGVTLSEKLFEQNSKVINILGKILATFLCFGVILATKELFTIAAAFLLPAFLNQAQWIIIGFSLPCSVFVSDYFVKKSGLGQF